MIFAAIGSQWGDEGKGRVVDFLSRKSDLIVRFQGGDNAGHTILVDGQKYVVHLVPLCLEILIALYVHCF